MTQSPATPLPSPKERRRLREAGSLTQAQVAERVGVTRETVRAWESGRTNPRGRKREVYARLLSTLVEEEEPRQPEVTASQESAPEVPEPEPQEPAAEPTSPSPPLTPAQAFDALYAFCAPALVRQAYLLTGRRELARESVERAFQLAWQRWPEVAVDRDPAGWVRATAYEYALSPWHRFRPRYRHPEAPPADASDRALLAVLLRLPTPQRRTLVLYDGVGLDLPETAAETEASTPAAAGRLMNAREAIAARLPDLSDPAELHRRLTGLASTERLRAARPPVVRTGSERRARFWTRAAIAFTVALIGTTALTVRTAPTHYEPPIAPGAEIQGVPPRVAQGPLSDAEVELREKLRGGLTSGPQRVLPLSR
ncbi:helix-turn-helix domain-containing protein [Streptomyces sp. NPDC051913]|uniref:helix-turn-helix domain-containing protein n=1 Tax=Streptomyces sp. NPDC051913 TaxID=3365676 RepID=UPI0037D5F32B